VTDFGAGVQTPIPKTKLKPIHTRQTTLMADCILVNSKFTAEVFRDTFRSSQVSPVVLYPSINLSAYDVPPPDAMRQ
jgi:hypothetical protein